MSERCKRARIETPVDLMNWAAKRDEEHKQHLVDTIFGELASMVGAVGVCPELIDCDAIGPKARAHFVARIRACPPHAPMLLYKADRCATFGSMTTAQCLEVLRDFAQRNPEDDNASQVILGITIAMVSHIGVPFDDTRLMAIGDSEGARLINDVLYHHDYRAMTIRGAMSVSVDID